MYLKECETADSRRRHSKLLSGRTSFRLRRVTDGRGQRGGRGLGQASGTGSGLASVAGPVVFFLWDRLPICEVPSPKDSASPDTLFIVFLSQQCLWDILWGQGWEKRSLLASWAEPCWLRAARSKPLLVSFHTLGSPVRLPSRVLLGTQNPSKLLSP